MATPSTVEDFNIDPTSEDFQRKPYHPMENGNYKLTVSEMPTVSLSQNQNRKINFKSVFEDNPDNYVLESLSVTPGAAWRIAQFQLAIGETEEISTSKLCSAEYLATWVGKSFGADIGSREILGKKPGPDGKLPVYIVNEVTQFTSEANPPRPYPVGTITSTSPNVAAYRLQQQMGGATEAPLASAVTNQDPQKMAF